MKIGYIINLWGKYYGHFLFERLVQKYPDVKIDIYFCAFAEKNRHYKIETPQSQYYRVCHLKGEISFGREQHFNFEIIPLILKHQYDIYLIGGYSYWTVALAIILLRTLRKKYILVIDHMYYKRGKKEIIKNIIKKVLIKKATAYITTSEESKNNLVSYGADSSKIFIAPLSCSDFFFLDYQNNNKHFEKPFEQYLLFVGRFEEYKGVRYLLEAFKIVKSQFNNINLVLIGSGPLEQDILKFIHDNKFNDSIKVYNWILYEELPLYYRNALCFVCPSTYEPWAFVVNEAMASGLPVIASDAVGAARALIKNRVNGFIVEQKNIQQIAEIIIELIKNKDLRDAISHNAYQTAKQYNIDKISDIYYQVFNHVLNAN